MDLCHVLGIDLSPGLALALDAVLGDAGTQGSVDTTSNSSQSLTDARQHVQTSFDVVVSALWRRRNEQAPINLLPVEVLSTIFRLYASSLLGEDRPMLNLVPHVCHHWRQVALRDCALWRDIHVTSARADEILADLLARTKRAPVSLDVALSATAHAGTCICADLEACERTGAIISQHLDHVESLILSFNDEQAGPLLNALTASAPRLTRLGLHLDIERSEKEWMDIPRNIFRSSAPLLRRLDLENVRPLDRRHFLLKYLEELCLSGNETLLPSHSMASFFSACPSLKSATFMHFGLVDPPALSSQKHWSCPALDAVSLDDLEPQSTLYLLRHLPLDEIPSLTLHCTAPHPQLAELVRIIYSSLTRPHFLSIRGERPHDDCRVELRDERALARTVSVSVRARRAGAHWPALLAVLQEQRLLRGVRHLRVSVGMWPGVPAGLHALRELTLEVGEDTLATFAPCIAPGARALQCPALETLRVASLHPTTLGGYLLLAFLELSVRYDAERLCCLALDNVVVEPGPALDAVLANVCKFVVEDRA